MSRGHRFDPVWRPHTDKDQKSIPRIIEVHWFRPALDSSEERPQLPTSVVPYRVLYSWGAAPTPDQYSAISSPLLVARTTPLPLGYSNKTNKNKPVILAFMYAIQAEPDPLEFGS
ncbi:hypothetical protein Tco_0883158 [Tanacetum coccineum]